MLDGRGWPYHLNLNLSSVIANSVSQTSWCLKKEMYFLQFWKSKAKGVTSSDILLAVGDSVESPGNTRHHWETSSSLARKSWPIYQNHSYNYPITCLASLCFPAPHNHCEPLGSWAWAWQVLKDTPRWSCQLWLELSPLQPSFRSQTPPANNDYTFGRGLGMGYNLQFLRLGLTVQQV